jgi:hypothetical protein
VALSAVVWGCGDDDSADDGGNDTGGRSQADTGGRNQADTGGRAATTGGRSATGGVTATGGSPATGECDDPNLAWKSANKTNYTSYPEPGSEECIEFNGCTWEGLFAACDDKKSEAWVSEHAIVAAFPDFEELELHDLCLRKGSKTIVVTVLDTCADSDCDGCCSENQGNADQLIDLESYTNARWGVPDGPIEWADLGPTRGTGCE